MVLKEKLQKALEKGLLTGIFTLFGSAYYKYATEKLMTEFNSEQQRKVDILQYIRDVIKKDLCNKSDISNHDDVNFSALFLDEDLGELIAEVQANVEKLDLEELKTLVYGENYQQLKQVDGIAVAERDRINIANNIHLILGLKGGRNILVIGNFIAQHCFNKQGEKFHGIKKTKWIFSRESMFGIELNKILYLSAEEDLQCLINPESVRSFRSMQNPVLQLVVQTPYKVLESVKSAGKWLLDNILMPLDGEIKKQDPWQYSVLLDGENGQEKKGLLFRTSQARDEYREKQNEQQQPTGPMQGANSTSGLPGNQSFLGGPSIGGDLNSEVD